MVDLLAGRINTFALLAVLFADCLAESFGAAITTVESTAAVVVIVVADAISFVLRRSAFCLAASGVQAQTLFAVFCGDSFLQSFGATITTIVLTTAIVVVVVAVAVSFVILSSAGAFAVA